MIALILKLLKICILRNVEQKTYIILDNFEQYEAIDYEKCLIFTWGGGRVKIWIYQNRPFCCTGAMGDTFE